jgi:hypothetical protein
MNQIRHGWASVAVVAVIALFAFSSTQSIQAQNTQEPPKQPADAQNQTVPQEPADVQQLKDRVKQLEQTVDELKKLIGTVEVAQKQQQQQQPQQPKQVLASDTSGGLRVIPSVFKTTPTGGSVVRTTGADMRPTTVSQDGDGDRSLEVYGFAMLDMGYQFKSNHPDWYDTIRPTKLPAFEGEFDPDGKFYSGVRQSRFGVKTSTPTRWGELKTIFEFELFGTGVDAGQTTFRLRHAYGELGQFGAGQYWTVFGDVDAFPNTFEYWGPNGLVWFRNVQIRWMPFRGRNELTLALERPGASGDQGVFAGRIELAGIRPQFRLPDFTGNVRFNRDWGHFQASWLLGSIKWVDTDDTDDFDFSGSDVRAGLSLTGVFNFNENNVGRFQGTYGQGTQNYMNDAPLDVGAKFNDDAPIVNPLRPTAQRLPEGEVGILPITGRAIPMFAMSAFLDHRWNSKFTSAIGYSMLNMENTSAQAPGAFRRGQYAVMNLLWSPIENFVMGGEYQWGRRNNFHDTFSSDDHRIQFSFKYTFGRQFKW